MTGPGETHVTECVPRPSRRTARCCRSHGDEAGARDRGECGIAVRATEQDWLRHGFGPSPRFSACIAECSSGIIGMVSYSERYYTGWPEPALYVQDIFVDPGFRRCGVARSLLAGVARRARQLSSPMIELTVRDNNSAQSFYQRIGFTSVPHCVNYVAAGAALAEIATAESGGSPARPVTQG